MNSLFKPASPRNLEAYQNHIRNFVTSKKSYLKKKNLSIDGLNPFSNYHKSECPAAPKLK
jgi:hypothetical protein